MGMIFSKDDLYAYGHWARSGLTDLGAVSAWLYIERGNVARSSRSKGKFLSDERADKLDKALCALCNRDEDAGDIFIDHYLKGMSERRISDARGCARSEVGKKIEFAAGYVIGMADFLYKNS